MRGCKLQVRRDLIPFFRQKTKAGEIDWKEHSRAFGYRKKFGYQKI